MTKIFTNIKYKIIYFFAILINTISKSKWNLLFTFSIINILFYFYEKSIVLFCIIEFILLPLCLTVKRVSNCTIYCKLLHLICMNLDNYKYFSLYDYEVDKDKIAVLFKEDFIKGVLNTNASILRCTTHKWVIDNVFNDRRITEKYNINYKKTLFNDKFASEVLLLSYGKTFNIHKRKTYKVTLKRKKR